MRWDEVIVGEDGSKERGVWEKRKERKLWEEAYAPQAFSFVAIECMAYRR
jgi:hypothetical protein